MPIPQGNYGSLVVDPARKINPGFRVSRITLADIQRDEEEERRKKQRQQNSVGFEDALGAGIYGTANQGDFAVDAITAPFKALGEAGGAIWDSMMDKGLIGTAQDLYPDDGLSNTRPVRAIKEIGQDIYAGADRAATGFLYGADAMKDAEDYFPAPVNPASIPIGDNYGAVVDGTYKPSIAPDMGTSKSNQQSAPQANVVSTPAMSSASYARHNNPLVTSANDYPAEQDSVYYDLDSQEYMPDIPAGYADVMHMQMQGANPVEESEFIGIAPELSDADRARLDAEFERSRTLDRAQMRRDHADSVLSRLVRDIRAEEDPGKRQGIAAGLGAYGNLAQNAGEDYTNLVTGYEASDASNLQSLAKLAGGQSAPRDMSTTIASLAKKHNVSSEVVAGLVRENMDKNGGLDLAEIESALSPAKSGPAPADMRSAMSRDYMDLVRSDDSLTPEKFLALRGIRPDDPAYNNIIEELHQALRYIPSRNSVQFEMEDSAGDPDYATATGLS